jgi:hypothetical protein
MTDPRDEFLPYWLRTATPSGGNGGLLGSLAQPADEPWNDPRPAQPVLKPWNDPRPAILAQTPWAAMTPPPNPFGLSPTFPSAQPPSGWDPSSASLWHTPFGATTGLLAPPAQPVLKPWNDPRPAILAQTPWVPMTPPPPFALPPTFPPALPLEHLDSGKFWPAASGPSGAYEQPPSAGLYPSRAQPAPSWDTVPRATAASAAQTLSQPRTVSSLSTPVPGVNTAGSWPVYEFDLTQDALRAGAEKIGRRGRRAPIPQPAPLPPPPEHLESAQYWGAAPGPSDANDQPSVNGSYLSPVGRAPSWEQVVPTVTPWSVSPKLPSPTSWGDITSGIECYTSGGNLHCITPGGRQFTIPAEGLPDGLRIAPGQPDYHYYDTPDGPVPFDAARLAQGIINNPTPGPRQLVRPATPQGTLNEATPYVGRTPPINPVMSYLTTDQNGTPLAVNVTQPGHGLSPGVVVRYVTTSPSGSTIQNEGAGLGRLQGPSSPGMVREGISNVWRGHSQEIIRPQSQKNKGKPVGR